MSDPVIGCRIISNFVNRYEKLHVLNRFQYVQLWTVSSALSAPDGTYVKYIEWRWFKVHLIHIKTFRKQTPKQKTIMVLTA